MLGKLLKYDCKANYPYMLVGYAVYILLTIGFTLSLNWVMKGQYPESQLEEMVQVIVMMSMTFLWIFSIMGVALMTFLLLVRRFYCNMVTDQGYLTLTLPVSARTHLLSKLISAVIFVTLTGCVLLAGVLVMVAGIGRSDVLVQLLDAFGRLFEALGVGFTVLSCFSGVLGVLQTILLIYFSICVGQLCAKHKVWGSIGAYLGISFGLNLVLTIVSVATGVMGYGGLITLFTENTYSILYVIFQSVLCLVYFFGGSWLLEKRVNLE